MTVENFEELNIWKDAKTMVVAVYEATSQSPLNIDFGFKDQFQRAVISIMNNIAEGFERDNNKEFMRFLTYSKGSAGEVRSMLYIALELKYITKEQFQKLYDLSILIIKQTASLKKYLKTRNRETSKPETK